MPNPPSPTQGIVGHRERRCFSGFHTMSGTHAAVPPGSTAVSNRPESPTGQA
jgi:hypothetical protein